MVFHGREHVVVRTPPRLVQDRLADLLVVIGFKKHALSISNPERDDRAMASLVPN